MQLIQEYKVPPCDEETHYVVQWLNGRNHPMQCCIAPYGEVMCESCDFVLANEGETIKIGHKCRRCQTPVIGFVPLTWREQNFKVEGTDIYSADEAKVIRALGEVLLEKDQENKLKVNVSRMDLSVEQLTTYGITGKYRLTIGMEGSEHTEEISKLAMDIWKEVEVRVWGQQLGEQEAAGFGILVSLHYPIQRSIVAK